MSKDFRKLRTLLRRDGWTVVLSRRGGHWRACGPNGEGPVFLPATPSDRRSLLNVRSELRRAGWRPVR